MDKLLRYVAVSTGKIELFCHIAPGKLVSYCLFKAVLLAQNSQQQVHNVFKLETVR